MNDLVQTRLVEFWQAVLTAVDKGMPDADVFEDENINKGYNRLYRAVEQRLAPRTKFDYNLWRACAGAVEDVVHPTIDPATARTVAWEFLAAFISDILSGSRVSRHFAIVPADRRFAGFPECTDLGLFTLLSVRSDGPVDRASRLIQLLIDVYSLDSMRDSESGSSDVQEVHRLREDLMHADEKLGGRLLSGPVLCLQIGEGMSGEFYAEDATEALRTSLAVLRLVSLDYRLRFDAKLLVRATYPDVPDLEIRALNVAVLTELYPVSIASIPARFEYVDTSWGSPFDPERFMEAWNSWGRDLLEFLRARDSDRLRQAVQMAVETVSRCLYPQWADVSLCSAIGLEAILNPFDMKSELSERLALFGSAILAASVSDRRRYYDAFKDLYRRRSLSVHRGTLWPNPPDVDATSKSRDFFLFLECLHHLVRWALDLRREGVDIDGKEFHEMYIRTLSKGLPLS